MTLTTALAILGGVVLLAIAVQAWWKLRRAMPRNASPAMPSAPTADRVEPPLDGEATEPGSPDTEPGDGPPPLRPAPRRVAARLDALIDAIVTLTLEAPITGEFILLHVPPSRRAGSKPFLIEGLDTATGTWEPPAPGQRYSELQAGVLMANRGGAINEIEYSEFVQKVQAFADSIGASTDVPDMLEVVARARELDALAAPLDAQLNITLRSNGVAWSVGFVQQVVTRQGLVAGGVPGRWVLPAADEGAPPMLVLSIDAQAALAAVADNPQGAVVRECQLTLDVPQTAASVEPFPAWHLLSKKLADDMDATAVDDQGRPLTLHAFDAIGREIDDLYQRLEQLDLAAGSPAARRLFS
jgi:hypothetical protein